MKLKPTLIVLATVTSITIGAGAALKSSNEIIILDSNEVISLIKTTSTTDETSISIPVLTKLGLPSTSYNIKVLRNATGVVEEMDVEDYIAGVIAGEMPLSFEKEALKAQAVAARTYLLTKLPKFGGHNPANLRESGADVIDTVSNQVYISPEEAIKKYGEEKWNRVLDVVRETTGEVLFYENNPLKEIYFFSTSSGKTENASDVFGTDKPYLRSVQSPGEELSKRFIEEVEISYSDIQSKITENINCIVDNRKKENLLKLKISNLTPIKILEYNNTGSIKSIMLGDTVLNGTEFRQLLNLNSTSFSFKKNIFKQSISFTTKGMGHGVGMSQWGANAMAQNGESYISILKHYFQGTYISRFKFDANNNYKK